MNELSTGKTMTVKEVAEQLRCTPEAVKNHIRELFPRLMENGKPTYLNEAQVTIILEKMRQPVSSGTVANLQSQIVGIEAPQSRALRIDLLHRQIEAEMETEIAELKTEVKTLAFERDEARIQYEMTHEDLRHANSKLEVVGLHLSDRDDMESLYLKQWVKRR
jgi:transcriptional antiterminator